MRRLGVSLSGAGGSRYGVDISAAGGAAETGGACVGAQRSCFTVGAWVGGAEVFGGGGGDQGIYYVWDTPDFLARGGWAGDGRSVPGNGSTGENIGD